ncbi:hypothetical protein FOL47_009045, partial [Perkinsus chesapeaki]
FTCSSMETLMVVSDSNLRGVPSPTAICGEIHIPIDGVLYETRLEALHAAIEKNQLSAVNRQLAISSPDALVLDECYSPHAVRSCRTPLRHAAFRGNARIVETLLEQPRTSAMAHYTDDGWSAIHSAAFQGQDEILITFLTKSADVHSSARFDGFGVLHIVAEVCNKRLGNDGADVMAEALKSTRGKLMYDWTPLHICCLKGKVRAAQLLLKAGAKASARTGAVCIHSVTFNDISSGRVRVDKIDPDNDADEGASDLDMTDEGLLPIHLAALGGHYNTVTMLLKYSSGGDMSAVMTLKHHWTLLHCAVWGGNVALVQEICRITNRKFVNTRDRRSDGSQWTPIAIAVARQNIEMVQCLLSFGADPTETIKLADFPGTQFVSNYPEIHDQSGDCPCDWSTEDDDITLMHLAVVAGDLAMLRCLVPIVSERHRREEVLAAKGSLKSGSDRKGLAADVGFINKNANDNKRNDPLGLLTAQGWSCAALAVLLHTVDPETRLQLRFVKGTIANKETCNRKEVSAYLALEIIEQVGLKFKRVG